MINRNYTNFDLSIEPLGTRYRARVLQSCAGEGSVEFDLPFSALELENFILKMGHTRRTTARGGRGSDSAEVAATKEFGEKLFAAVFQGDVYACLRGSLEQARPQKQGVRVLLRLPPELINLPWEYLYNPNWNLFFSLSSDTPLIRYLELTPALPPLPVTLPLRLLVMISSPSDYPALDVEREWADLQSALQPLVDDGLVVIERLKNATLLDLQRQLRRGEYHIFHFIGHGLFNERKQDGMLIFTNRQGRGDPHSGQDLGTLLRDHHALRLVVLNACEGARTGTDDPFAGAAHSLVQMGLPAVIAMQFEISDATSILFAQEFYTALADGYGVDAALGDARKAIFAEQKNAEWGTPVLFSRVWDGRVFELYGGENGKTLNRRLDAAMPQQAQVGHRTEVRVLVALHNSEGLRGCLSAQPKSCDLITREDVIQNEVPIEFPVDSTTGQQLSIELTVVLTAPDFSVDSPIQKIRVPSHKDSGVIAFFLTPNISQLYGRVCVELYIDDKQSTLIGTVTLITEVKSRVDQVIEKLWCLATFPFTLATQSKSNLGTPKTSLVQSRIKNLNDSRRTFEPEMVRVAAGEFWMGSTPEQAAQVVKDGAKEEWVKWEQPQHKVMLKEYAIGKYPITCREYQAFVQDSGRPSPQGWCGREYPDGKGDHPVVNVAWDDAQAYCVWLSQKTGKSYRLPSEAEWEKAARGTDGWVYPWGSVKPDKSCCNIENWFGDTTRVGKFSPQGDSPYGGVDMIGNVWEWCADWFDERAYANRAGKLVTDPLGPYKGTYRSLRGGSWGYNGGDARCASRGGNAPDSFSVLLGFRLVLSLAFSGS